MNGAGALIRTLVACGVDVCFTNPGTSEMHFVAALDDVPEMRAILGLFEGVVTGAADGYARMSGRPAAALLHLGPGLGNGLANLHNARRGGVPVVTIVGDHATYHRGLGAPLDSDIETVARNVSRWVRTSAATAVVGVDAAAAVAAARSRPGEIATLILPADVSWTDGGVVGAPLPVDGPGTVEVSVVDAIARVVRSGQRTVVLLGGSVLADPDALAAARAIAATSGAVQVLGEVFPTRLARGGAAASLERLAYFPDQARPQLADAEHLVLVETALPVTFFAYPGQSSALVPEGCTVHTLAQPSQNGPGALAALVDALDAHGAKPGLTEPPERPARPTGALDTASAAAAVGALLPEQAIVSDEALTAGLPLPAATAGAPPHDWLTITGGAIGQGLPVATGAAVACPDRKVVALQADGSAMYTLQALWTQAHEGLDVTTVIYNNGAYDILAIEMDRVGVDGAGPAARALFDLTGPRLDFVALATGMGVPASRAGTADEFVAQLDAALATDGPALVEAMVPRMGG